MTVEMGVLAAGAAAFGAVVVAAGIGVALGRGQPERRVVWLRRSDRIVLAAAALTLAAFLAVAIVDLFAGDKPSALFGTTSGLFRFVLDLLVFAGLVPAVALASTYLIAMVRLWALAVAPDEPSERDTRNTRAASWVVFGVLIALPLAAIAYDVRFLVEDFFSLTGDEDLAGWRILVTDAMFLAPAVFSAVLVRRGHAAVAAYLLAATVLAWPVFVIARASGVLGSDMVVRVGVWYLVVPLALAVSLIWCRTPTPPVARKVGEAGTPTQWGYVLGALILVIGVGSAMAIAVAIAVSRPSAPTEAVVVPMPGSGQVVLDARPYALYLARGGGTRDLHTGIRVTGPDGDVPVIEYRDTGPTWGVGDQGWTAYDGEVFATIEPPVAGSYEVSAQIPSSWTFRPAMTLPIVVGDPPPHPNRWGMWSAELLAAVSALVGISVIAVTLLRRHRTGPMVRLPAARARSESLCLSVCAAQVSGSAKALGGATRDRVAHWLRRVLRLTNHDAVEVPVVPCALTWSLRSFLRTGLPFSAHLRLRGVVGARDPRA